MGFVSLLYGVAVYVFFLATFLYAIAFAGNLWVAKTIDSGAAAGVAESLLVNLGLLAIFALQHSIMARRSFKRWWTRIVSPAVERSTYVLAATLALALLLWQWRPIPEPVIWSVESAAGTLVLRSVFWLGWTVLLVSTFLINHFELFGLRQVFARLAGHELPEAEFRTPFFYRYVRHPLYVGWLLTFWSAPVMTVAHLFFAAMTTAYILMAIRFEEADLMSAYGDTYRRYRTQVPMIIPALRNPQEEAVSKEIAVAN